MRIKVLARGFYNSHGDNRLILLKEDEELTVVKEFDGKNGRFYQCDRGENADVDIEIENAEILTVSTIVPV